MRVNVAHVQEYGRNDDATVSYIRNSVGIIQTSLTPEQIDALIAEEWANRFRPQYPQFPFTLKDDGVKFVRGHVLNYSEAVKLCAELRDEVQGNTSHAEFLQRVHKIISDALGVELVGK